MSWVKNAFFNMFANNKAFLKKHNSFLQIFFFIDLQSICRNKINQISLKTIFISMNFDLFICSVPTL